MTGLYPILFQERRIGRKHEVGRARSSKLELAVRKLPDTLFPSVHPLMVLSKCLFVNSYDDSISGITVTSSIRVWPKGGSAKDAILKLGSGFKLDRAPDGWTIKPLKGRPVTLSEDFLRERGWKFEALRP
jgi:hypothetical protein